MSHTRVKTTFERPGNYGSTETVELYCHHNGSCDSVAFYYADGNVVDMVFESWVTGNDLWDAMQRLWFPFKGEWHGELKEGVEYYYVAPWEKESEDN